MASAQCGRRQAERFEPGRRSRSMLSLYRALIRLRRESEALSIGDWRFLAATEHVLAYERRLAGERVMIALNMTGDAQTVRVADRTCEILLSTVSTRPAPFAARRSICAPRKASSFVRRPPPSRGFLPLGLAFEFDVTSRIRHRRSKAQGNDLLTMSRRGGAGYRDRRTRVGAAGVIPGIPASEHAARCGERHSLSARRRRSWPTKDQSARRWSGATSSRLTRR